MGVTSRPGGIGDSKALPGRKTLWEEMEDREAAQFPKLKERRERNAATQRRRRQREREEREQERRLRAEEEEGRMDREEARANAARAAEARSQGGRGRKRKRDWVGDGHLPFIHRTMLAFPTIYSGVQYLRRLTVPPWGTKPYADLPRSTVQSWYIDGHELVLRDQYKKVLENEVQPSKWRKGAHHGRRRFEERQPAVVMRVSQRLRSLREGGVPLSSMMV